MSISGNNTITKEAVQQKEEMVSGYVRAVKLPALGPHTPSSFVHPARASFHSPKYASTFSFSLKERRFLSRKLSEKSSLDILFNLLSDLTMGRACNTNGGEEEVM
jgi:hypothetical protein